MGGAVAWTLRLRDGTEYRMKVWTNPIPGLVQDLDFLTEKPEAIYRIVNPWMARKADWEENRLTGSYRIGDTPIFAPYPHGLFPCDYGLIVTDFKTRKFFSYQGYSTLDQIPALRLQYPDDIANEDSKTDTLKTFIAANRIRHYRLFARNEAVAKKIASSHPGTRYSPLRIGRLEQTVLVPGSTPYASLIETCDRLKVDTLDRPISYPAAVIDLSPFTYERFDTRARGCETLLARVRDLGFSLSEAEEKGWEEQIRCDAEEI